MALPTINDVTPVDPVLTNASIGFRNDAFIAERVAPFLESAIRSGTLIIYDRADALRLPGGAERASSGPYRRVGFGVGTNVFQTVEHGFEISLDDPTIAASQTPDDLETHGLQHITHLMELEIEVAAAAAAFVTGVWGTSATLTAAQRWSNYETSNPMTTSKTAIRTVRRNTGVDPNALVIGALGMEDLQDHPLILEKYKHTQAALLTEELIAAALGVAELVVGKSIRNTGAQSGTFAGSDIWTDNALWLVQNNPGLETPNGAWTYIWNETGGAFPWAVQAYREEGTRAAIQRIFSHFVVEIVSAEHGYMALNTN